MFVVKPMTKGIFVFSVSPHRGKRKGGRSWFFFRPSGYKYMVLPLWSPKTWLDLGGKEREAMGSDEARKPRLLCLHGFRTSAEIMKKQIGKWPQSVLGKLDLVFVDAPFPAEGKSDVEGIFPPPYYEWFQFDREFTEYRNFEECLAYIEEQIIKLGPFDGLLGFSQGAILSAGLVGLQKKGLALTRVPKLNCLIIISGGKFANPTIAENAYSSPTQVPSLHFIGETDFLKPYGTKLLESFVDPVVIHHPKGHTVPRLVSHDKSDETMLDFIEGLQKLLPGGATTTARADTKLVRVDSTMAAESAGEV
ncbi:uncharacterized protein [Aristolochia californica]|uniref:uncharacterized protein n=1 Tax=Aristolochia californica TaxID=171875 RepID=UPI0035DEE309